MKRLRLTVAVLLIALAALFMLGPFQVRFTPYNEPLLNLSSGHAVVENCQQPTEKQKLKCAGLFCEQAIYNQGLVPLQFSPRSSRHSHNFSNAPASRSVHMYSYKQNDDELFFKCEMDDLLVIEVAPISKAEFQ